MVLRRQPATQAEEKTEGTEATSDQNRPSEHPLNAVFLYAEQKQTTGQFISQLKDYRINARAFPAEDLSEELLSDTDLIIVGTDTGRTWNFQPAVDIIRDSQVPVLAMGEGGYTLFGKLGLRIGEPHGERAGALKLWPNKEAIFWDGFRPQLIDGLHDCFSAGSLISIKLDDSVDGVIPIAAEGERRNHFPLIVQKPYYLLWGFNNTAEQLTQTGKELLPWTCYYTVAMKRNPRRAFMSATEVSTQPDGAK